MIGLLETLYALAPHELDPFPSEPRQGLPGASIIWLDPRRLIPFCPPAPPNSNQDSESGATRAGSTGPPAEAASEATPGAKGSGSPMR